MMRAAGRLSQCRARRAGGADSRHTCKERADGSPCLLPSDAKWYALDRQTLVFYL